jgi:surface protein
MAVTFKPYTLANKTCIRDNKICGRQMEEAFRVTVETTDTPQDFTFYLVGAVSLRMLWGDGSENTYTGSDGNKTHSYATPGTYTITFVSGTATRVCFGGDGGVGATPTLLKMLVTPVASWLGLTSAKDMFRGCTGLGNTGWCAEFFDGASAKVTSMADMFRGCSAFNQSVANFNTALVTNLYGVFYDCTAFNQSVSNFDTSKATNMSRMFRNCSAFNQSVSNFDTAKVTNTSYMFYGCAAFNQSVANFNTAKVTTVYAMFYGCTAFNQSVANFNTALVTDMSYMFYGCSAFNQSVSNFDTAKVTDMSHMFQNCSVFNQSVANFDTAKVTNMVYMFSSCTAFNQDISTFVVTALTIATSMLQGSGFTQTNYDKLLDIDTGWPSQAVLNSVPFHAGTAKYGAGKPTDGRDHLTGVHSWTITDGGAA